MRKPPAALAALAAAAVITLAGCHGNGSSSGHAAASSLAANPTASAELAQGRALVASCFPGTLLQETFGWGAARSAAYLSSLPGGGTERNLS